MRSAGRDHPRCGGDLGLAVHTGAPTLPSLSFEQRESLAVAAYRARLSPTPRELPISPSQSANRSSCGGERTFLRGVSRCRPRMAAGSQSRMALYLGSPISQAWNQRRGEQQVSVSNSSQNRTSSLCATLRSRITLPMKIAAPAAQRRSASRRMASRSRSRKSSPFPSAGRWELERSLARKQDFLEAMSGQPAQPLRPADRFDIQLANQSCRDKDRQGNTSPSSSRCPWNKRRETAPAQYQGTELCVLHRPVLRPRPGRARRTILSGSTVAAPTGTGRSARRRSHCPPRRTALLCERLECSVQYATSCCHPCTSGAIQPGSKLLTNLKEARASIICAQSSSLRGPRPIKIHVNMRMPLVRHVALQQQPPQCAIALPISSVIFLASPSSIMVLSR